MQAYTLSRYTFRCVLTYKPSLTIVFLFLSQPDLLKNKYVYTSMRQMTSVELLAYRSGMCVLVLLPDVVYSYGWKL